MTALDDRLAYVQMCAEVLGSRRGIEPSAILGRTRVYAPTLARHLIIYRCWRTGWTTVAIGGLLGLNHSTISHATGRVPRLLTMDAAAAADYDSLPAFEGARLFTEPSLVDLYQRLTEVVAEAYSLRERIEAKLAAESVPTRLRVVG